MPNNPTGLLWWAYLHKNDEVTVKRWVSPHHPQSLCDLCHAMEEYNAGNSFIKDIVLNPFYAEHSNEARDKAYFLSSKEGGPLPLRLENRFELIAKELDETDILRH